MVLITAGSKRSRGQDAGLNGCIGHRVSQNISNGIAKALLKGAHNSLRFVDLHSGGRGLLTWTPDCLGVALRIGGGVFDFNVLGCGFSLFDVKDGSVNLCFGHFWENELVSGQEFFCIQIRRWGKTK